LGAHELTENVHPFKRKQDAARTADGFANLVQKSGLLPGLNSVSSGTYTLTNLLSKDRIKLEAMYRQNWVVGALVDSVAEDMTRAGIKIEGIDDPSKIEEIQEDFNNMLVWDALLDNIKWGRLYGGSLAVIQIEGQDTATPLRVETVGLGQFQGLAVFDRWMVQPDLQSLIKSGPHIGLPEYYRIVTGYDMQTGKFTFGTTIHYSRCVRQIGIKLPTYQAMVEEYWGESVVERLLDRLISFDTATMGAANLIDKAHLRRIGIDGLREILASGGPAEENLVKMFSYVRMMQTNEGITLLDKEDVWETGTYTFSGLSDMMLQFGQQLAGATGIPLVRLFGMSPAGLNSSGESDLRTYYDGINTKQESSLRTPVQTLLRVIYQSRYGVTMPSTVRFKFNPLWQMSDTEKATNAKTTTESVLGAYDSGLIPAETALKELRASSENTGIFANITDEQIEEAKGMEPPAADVSVSPALQEPAAAVESQSMTMGQRLLAFVKGAK
jgi:phage-related protein (TIGR01555 family)